MDRFESFEVANPRISVQWLSGEIILKPSSDEVTRITLTGDGKNTERIIEEAIITLSGDQIKIHRKDKSKAFRSGSFTFGIENKVRVLIEHPHAASLTVKAVSADLTGSTSVDAIDIFTVSGDTHLTGQSKEIRIKSVSGDTNVLCAAQGNTQVSTVSGSTTISASKSGSIEIKSVSGDSVILVSPGLVVDVDAETHTGKLSSEIPLDQNDELSMANQGTLRINTKSLSGDTRIARAGMAESR